MLSTDDVIVYSVVGVLGLLALATIVSVLRRRAGLIRDLRDVDGFLDAMRSEGESKHGLVRAVREHVVGARTQDGKIVLSRPLPALRREFADDEIAHTWSFWVGSLLTGIALIATFLLIARAMSNDVSGAIRESVGADEKASTGHLAQAVTLLGGKFLISAAGIGGSVIALLVSNFARAGVYRAAEHPGPALMSAFTSVEAQQLSAKLHELELLRDERETRELQHNQIRDQLLTLNTRIEKLNSIEVSVKTIGNEVSANLKNIMKDAMGEQLKGMLSDTMAEVAGIAQTVQQNLTDSFGKQLQTLTTELQRSLATLQKAIEGQGQGQLEKLLAQLQNTVSGGYHNESQKMVEALEGFARVVPALEQQLRAMTGKVAEETRQRSEETSRLTQMMMDRVTSLLDTMTAQQAANAQVIERIQAVSEQGAEAMARRLETSGSSMVSNVLGASRAEIEAIVGQLKAAADASSRRYSDIETQAGNAAASVANASEGLVRSANAVIEVANKTSELVSQTRGESEAIQAAAREFQRAGQTLLGSVSQIQQVIEHTRTQTSEQQQLLLRQREYTKEVEKLWPEMFNTYLTQLKASNDELGRHWESFHQKIAQVSNTIGGDFAQHTEILSEAVDRLVKLTADKRVAT